MSDNDFEKINKELEEIIKRNIDGPKKNSNQSKLKKGVYFVEGLFIGSVSGLIFNSDNYSIIKSSVFFSVVTFPVINKFLYNKSYMDSFENSPYIGAGIILGDTFVKYLKE